jgi:hypothetical protein
VLKIKRGTKREDGYLFEGYLRCGGKSWEQWLSPEAFHKKNERKKAWYNSNKDRHAQNGKLWASSNREKSREIKRSWAHKNIDWFLDRKKKLIASCRLTCDDRNTIKEIYSAARRVSRCLGIQFHVDHIVPVSRGGVHHQSNLQLLPAVVNLRKSDKIN